MVMVKADGQRVAAIKRLQEINVSQCSVLLKLACVCVFVCRGVADCCIWISAARPRRGVLLDIHTHTHKHTHTGTSATITSEVRQS